MFRATAYQILLTTTLLAAFASLGCSSGQNAQPMPQFQRCKVSSDCGAGVSCQSGVCVSGEGEVSTDTACSSDGSCPTGMDCKSGQCVVNIVYCAHDTNCGYQELCVKGQCQPRGRVPEGKMDRDCEIGTCQQGKCR